MILNKHKYIERDTYLWALRWDSKLIRCWEEDEEEADKPSGLAE